MCLPEQDNRGKFLQYPFFNCASFKKTNPSFFKTNPSSSLILFYNKQMRQNKQFYASIGILSLLFIIWSCAFIYQTSFVIDGDRYFSLFDDAMISMKYAWQLAHGHGLVWNSLGRVEGYTNPLWTVLMAISNIFLKQRYAVLSIQILGIGIILGIVSVTIKIANISDIVEKKHKQLLAYFIAVFIFTYYPLTYWTLMGMETGLLTLLILIAILYMFKFKKSLKSRDGFLFSSFLSLAYLTRPDSLYLAMVIFCGTFYLIDFSRIKRNISKKLVFFGAFYLFVVLIHVLFRLIYYGELIPNTVILKVAGVSTWFRIESGLGFIKPFLLESIVVIIFALIAAIYQRTKIAFFILSSFFATCIYQIFVGGDSWNYWRFLVPTMPLVFILAAVGIFYSARLLTNKISIPIINQKSLFLIICFLITIGSLYMHNKRFINQIFFHEQIFSVEYNAINTNFALRLMEISKPNATIGVIWAGSIPYYSERDGIDFLGKSDKYIAHLNPDLTVFTGVYGMKTLPGHNKYDLEYSIIKLQPDVIERADWANQSVYARPDFNYKTIKYKGATLHLRRDSKNIYWKKIGK